MSGYDVEMSDWVDRDGVIHKYVRPDFETVQARDHQPTNGKSPRSPIPPPSPGERRNDDLPLFAAVAPGVAERSGPSPAEEALRVMDPDGMSPREAMEALYRLRAMLRS